MPVTVTYPYLRYGGIWTTTQATDAVAQSNWAVPPSPHLFAWGTSSAGQLGLGNTASYSSPKQVGSLTNWLVIAAGYGNTAAIKTDGTLWTWGQNNQGQSGLNNTTYYSSPKQVGALTNWSYLASGSYHVAAIKTDGTLWCWGYNSFGQVGNNTSGTSISSPVQIGSLTNWLKVTAGYYHNVAVKTDGTLWSWGWNAYGQLGLGNVAHYSSPKQIGSGTTWSNIACGYAQTFATKTDGTIWSWGYGVYGATGQQTTTNYSSPKQIGALTTWLTPASGRITGYSIKTDGTLWAWGYNGQGNLANGNIANNYSSPIQIGSATNWSKVTGSYYSVYGIKTDGTLYSWGANAQGQLGLGNTTNRSSVNQVGALTSWTTLPTTSAGYFILAIANT